MTGRAQAWTVNFPSSCAVKASSGTLRKHRHKLIQPPVCFFCFLTIFSEAITQSAEMHIKLDASDICVTHLIDWGMQSVVTLFDRSGQNPERNNQCRDAKTGNLYVSVEEPPLFIIHMLFCDAQSLTTMQALNEPPYEDDAVDQWAGMRVCGSAIRRLLRGDFHSRNFWCACQYRRCRFSEYPHYLCMPSIQRIDVAR
ncbi:hypothetical protein [Brucella pituitosa]|uniref:hypothetical protein n=1 Tax=Brucella pituitosa TaxID=571256 RepID=UPI0013747F23|nr:hypothetical protein [Brucella pituitosa]